MRDARTARRERRARLEQRLSGRIPKAPGRTIDPARRLRGLVDTEEDAPPPVSRGLIGDAAAKLGPRGRFLAAAVFIGAMITGGSVFWDRYSNQTAISADHTNAAQVGLGRSLYGQHCAYCHGVDLAGKPGWDGEYPDGSRPALPLDGSAPIWRLSDRDIFDVTKFGGQPFSPPSYRNEMPAFEGQLADADIWAILAFIKSRWPEETRAKQQEVAAENG
jgi:mono/diheme cytochrome c family protein